LKFLMFGKNGQVAREVLRCAGHHHITALGRDEADLSRPGDCARAIKQYAADVILNAAAYTAVDRAENEPALANQINANAPAEMAKAAHERGLPFIHISTDYVFDGSGHKPWTEQAKSAPLGVYGLSKRNGEIGVLAAHSAAIILRTSWVFSAHGNNFVKTMLRLGKEKDSLNIVDDQFGGPTSAADIAQTLIAVAENGCGKNAKSGIFHYSGLPDTNWKEFATEIFRQSGMSTKINGIPSSAYPTPARRPANSRLNCSRLALELAIDRPEWQLGLTAVLHELGERR